MSLTPSPQTFPPSSGDGGPSAEETLGHYRIFRRPDGGLWELGRGAMGVTYKAVDTNLDKPVALKIINGQSIGQENARKRFRREARSAASLHHRHIAGVFHFGESSGSFFYAMEYIDGETGDALVKREGPLPWRTALEVALQVSRALMAAHAKDLVHRDIKPANIMVVDEVDERGVVKLIDFGLAKSAAEKEGSHSVTNVSGFLGTPLYASPEQCEEIPADIRSDIYSLGVTLWFMLTGEPTFVGNLGKVFHQQMHAAPPWEKLPADLPREVRTLLERMLAKDRADRQQTPAELRTEIEQCLQVSGGAGSVAPGRTRTPAPGLPLVQSSVAGASSRGGTNPPPPINPPGSPVAAGTSRPATAAPVPPVTRPGNLPSTGGPTGEETLVEPVAPRATKPPPVSAPSEWRQKKGLIVATAVVGLAALIAMGDNSSDSSTAKAAARGREKARKAQIAAAKVEASANKRAEAAGKVASANAIASDSEMSEMNDALRELGIEGFSFTGWKNFSKEAGAKIINSVAGKVENFSDLSERAKAYSGLASAQAKLGDTRGSQQRFAQAIQTAKLLSDGDEKTNLLAMLAKQQEKVMAEVVPSMPSPPAPPTPPEPPKTAGSPAVNESKEPVAESPAP